MRFGTWPFARCADYGDLDSIPAMAEAVLQAAPDRFSIAGHSMGGRVALEIYRRAPKRVARIALLNTGYLPLAAGAAGEEETRKRGELVALAQSQGMRAMLRQWLPPMIDSRRINDTVLVNAIIGNDVAARLPRFSPHRYARCWLVRTRPRYWNRSTAPRCCSPAVRTAGADPRSTKRCLRRSPAASW